MKRGEIHLTSTSQQFKALALKSLSFQRRQYRTNACQALIPVLMVSILAVLQLTADSTDIPYTPHPDTYPPLVVPPPDPNLHILYTAPEGLDMGTCCSTRDGFLGNFSMSIQNDGGKRTTIGKIPTAAFSFDRAADKAALDDTFYSGYPTGRLMAYMFDTFDTVGMRFQMTTLHNFTMGVPAYINLAHNALLRTLTSPSATLITRLKGFPTQAKTTKSDVVSGQENFWYLFMLSFCMIIFVQNIVYEKEHRLRESMKMAGLKMHVYWIVTYIFDYVLYLIVMLVLIIYGNILQFRFFTQTDPSVYFVLFFLFGFSMVSFCFFLSCLMSKEHTASIITFIYVMFISLTANIMNNAFIGNPDTPLAAFIVTAFVPHFTFHRIITYISIEYLNNHPGLTWSGIVNHSQMPLLFGFLFMEAVGYLILHQYLEAVLPSQYGSHLSPVFFLKPSFWRGLRQRRVLAAGTYKEAGTTSAASIHSTGVDPSDEGAISLDPADVSAERTNTFAASNFDSIRLFDLGKVFRQGGSGKKVEAVSRLSLSVSQGQCFGLLGPNGAGKTTTLSVLCGLYTPTSGTAIINQFDIKEQLGFAQLSLGVCPQYDVLWGELTGREHLLFFGRMKGYVGAQLNAVVDQALKEVLLVEAQHKPSKSYSGGMKRRLSLAIALIGDPLAVILDEPTTGVDPFSRRVVWDVIKSKRPQSAIILTTHNMEEADVLCDRVCIVDKGVMKCIGQSVELKARYGAGYTLTITSRDSDGINGAGVAYDASAASGSSVSPQDVEINTFVCGMVPGATLINSLAGTRSWTVPRASVRLSTLFAQIEQERDRLNITDWGITQSTLEEVLLQTATHD
eukprot:TRINITY_DN3048_c0_g1_i1.p1 TRINITY_DN3048_c0_g1~~TRINITY_DN3048_c0_g1_i1.p1  ORF type:complete len:846 (+),score=207.73 TRINITY_DN3048_c0_g1_i1:85-2622(+)